MKSKPAKTREASTPYVVLLRAVNLPRHQPVTMADLRAAVAGAGFDDVQTLLQSGNIVLRSPVAGASTVERRVAGCLRDALALDTDVMARSATEWSSAIASNPFRQAAVQDPSHLVLLCLAAEPPAAAFDALVRANKGPERLHLDGRQLYAIYPDGIGKSRLTTAFIERWLRTRVTGRNWNTVLKLAALCSS